MKLSTSRLKIGVILLYLSFYQSKRSTKMNPLTNMRNVKKLSEQELERMPKSSWHDEYKSSAWIFVGGLPYDLSEGDIMAIFSQYGEIVNLNLVRDKDTGKQKGFCFICYEDQRSTILAVDNFNGTRVLGRILRVDHVKDYKPPKNTEPNAKVKVEKIDYDEEVGIKKDVGSPKIKREVLTPEIKREYGTHEIKREIHTPEIKREMHTPEIKRELCSPKIIRSPDYKSVKVQKKSKEHHENNSRKSRSDEQNQSPRKDKHNKHHKHHKDRTKEKEKRHRSNDRDESRKKSRRSKSSDKYYKGDSYKRNHSRDRSMDRKGHYKSTKRDNSRSSEDCYYDKHKRNYNKHEKKYKQ